MVRDIVKRNGHTKYDNIRNLKVDSFKPVSFGKYISTYKDSDILDRKQFMEMITHENTAIENRWTTKILSNLFIEHILTNIHKRALKEREVKQ